MSRHRYPIEACRVFERTDFTKLKAALSFEVTDGNESSEILDASGDACDESKKPTSGKNKKVPASNKKSNDGTQSNKTTLKTILGKTLSYGPALSEHIILDAGLPPIMKVGKDTDSKIDEATIQALVQAVASFEDWLADVISGQIVPEGYILMQNKVIGKKETSLQESTSDKVYWLLLLSYFLVVQVICSLGIYV